MEFIILASSRELTDKTGFVQAALAKSAMVRPVCEEYLAAATARVVIAVQFAVNEYASQGCPGHFFDGCAVYRKALYTARRPPTVPLPGFYQSARGSYCYVCMDEYGKTVVSHDLLGMYPVWSSKAGEYFIVSNNLYAVVELREILGYETGRNPFFSACEVTMEHGLWSASPFRDVYLLPTDASIEIQSDGKERIIHHQPWFYTSGHNYTSLIEAGCHELQENVTAIAGSSFENRVVDLTGGYDSRLTAAAILSAKVADKFSFVTQGRNTADAVPAAYIRNHFDLTRADFIFSHSPANVIENIRRSLWFLYGQHNQPLLVNARKVNTTINLNNVGGENFRQSANISEDGDPLEGIIRMFGYLAGFMKQSVRDEILAGYADFFQQKKGAGFSASHAQHHLYLEHKNPQFSGVLIRALCNVMPVAIPVYSPSAIAAALVTSDKERISAKVCYDMIKILCPDLIYCPLEDRRWPLVDAEDEERLATVMPCKDGDAQPEHIGRTVDIVIPQINANSRPLPETQWSRQAKNKALPWFRVHLDAALNFGAQCLSDNNFCMFLDSSFDIDKLRKLFNAVPETFNSNYTARQVWKLLHVITWLSKNETRDTIY